MADAPLLEATGLRKRFGETQALDGLDLIARTGEVLAVLGPNGAGKSTFVRTLCTLATPDSGTLRLGGVDVLARPREARRLLGMAGQYAAVEQMMTGRENLEMVARLFGHDRAGAKRAATIVLEQLSLTDAGDLRVKGYSGGMRRRLDLGASLVGAPRLLVLDEPTTGLDPRGRAELWDVLGDLVASGTDVLLTTQYLEEADRLAQRIAVVDHGKVVADGTPSELKAAAGRDVLEVRVGDLADLDAATAALAAATGATPIADPAGRRVTAPVTNGTRQLVDAVSRLDEAGVVVDDIGLRRPTLDDVFLALTGSATDAASDQAGVLR